MQRPSKTFFLSLLATLWLVSSQALATAAFARLFSTDMVLQRGKPIHVWGTGAVAEGVTVSFNSQSVTGTIGADGKWSVYLPSMVADAVGKTLSVVGTSNTVNLTNVVVGDVWLVSGQSNMEFPLNDPNPPYGWPAAAQPNGATDASTSNLPGLRIFNVPSWPVKVTTIPQSDLPAGISWAPAVSVSNPNLRYTSALGFYFARSIHQATGVPIGLLQIAYGGSPAEAFISLEALQAEPNLAIALPVGTPVPANPNYWPTGIFNGEINPVTPFSIKGILWDQGESNTAVYGGSASSVPTAKYGNLMTTLIKDWRHRFGEELPFYLVQLQNISQLSAAGVNQAWADNCNALQTSNNGWGDVRWGQFQTLSLTKTGMSVNFELNPAAQYWNSDSTQMAATNYHPSNKEAFAGRLSPWALTADYGLSVGAYKGPLYVSATKVGATMQVLFDSALATSDSQPARGFMLGDAGGSWVWADSVVLAGNLATVSAVAMPNPTKVKYAWGYNPADTLCGPSRIGNLSDTTGLWLASPFQNLSEPIISVTGSSAMPVRDQDMLPLVADGRDMGSVDMVAFVTQAFDIHNIGSATLNLTGGVGNRVRIAGTHAADFSITVHPNSSIAAGNTSTFTVRFQPNGVGPRSAYLLIPSDDQDHSPYYIYLKGVGTSSITPTITPTPTITQTPTITATPTETPLTTPVPTGTYTVLPTEPKLRYTGRFDFAAPNAPRFDWPGVMIEAAFTGTSVGILLSEQWANYNWYDVYVDGSTTPTKFQTNATAVTQYNITGLSAGTHTIKIVHRGEGFSGDAEGSSTGNEIATFHGLVLNGGESIQPLPYPRPSRRIEVIGDSISAGYGNESSSTTCGAPAYERPYTNNYLAYASIASRAFCAEVHSTAVSGHGLCHNYNSASPLSAQPMPVLFNRTLSSLASPVFDFNSWQADVVIIYLGTNDFSNINPPSQAQYEAAYHSLIADVRSKYSVSQPHILCLHANYPASYAAWVSNVVTYQRNTLGDLKVHDVDLGSLASANGCSFHPDLVGQQLLANTVITAIGNATGWTSGVCATDTPTPTPCGACTNTFTPTITQTPTITPTPIVPCEDWDFDAASLQGWTVNSGPGTNLVVAAGAAHEGAGGLSVDLGLAQGGSNNSVILSNFTGFPRDYTGKTLHAWVYVPAGMSDPTNPSAAMLVLSSGPTYNWNSSPWVNLSNAGGWSELILDTSTMAFPAEANDIRGISIQFGLGGTSPAWSGTVYVDSVGRNSGVCVAPTGTPTSTATPTLVAGSPTSTATPTFSSTRTATPSASSTPSSTTTASASPTVTPTWTDVPPGSTLTNTPQPSETSTATPTATATPTQASTSTSTASPTATPSSTVALGSATSSASPTPSASSTRTATPSASSTHTSVVAGSATFSSTRTSTPTHTSVVTAVAGIPTQTPSGALEILDLQAVPNPNPSSVAVKLNGNADSIEIKVYSVAGVCVAQFESGSAPGGWSQVVLPPMLGNGAFFVRAVAKRGSQRSLAVPPLKLLVLR